MRAPRLRTQVRRDQIAAAAMGVIAARGMRALSVAAVAREVGLAPSALYRHFKSRDEMIDAALDLLRDKLLGNVAAVRAETADPIERLRRLLRRDVRLISEHKALPRVLFSEEVYDGGAARRRRTYRMMRAYLDEIAEICRQGQREGRVDRHLDAPLFAMLFIGVVRPAAVLRHLSGGRFDAERHAERSWAVLRAILQGSGGRPGRRRSGQPAAAEGGPRGRRRA